MNANDNISIELTPVGNPVTKWEMSMNGGKKMGPGEYPTANVPHGDTGVMTFTINGGPNSNVTFAAKQTDPTNISNPFCAQLGSTKPTACGGPFSYPSGGGTQLVVTDNNNEMSAASYYYVLNFNGAPQLDPIINNGGNGIYNPGPRFTSTQVIEAVVLILVLIVIALFAWRMFRSPENTTKGP
ncbi:MAG TPA: hypothetical protein VGQ34_01705 [Sphingomicrobium sp.]|jgi:hypothetical protein|nr:hypothetical protein [Sphingomicrobium sp.]